MSATGKNYVVDSFTGAYSTALLVPGTVVESEGFEYRFILCGDTDAVSAGMPLTLDSPTAGEWKGCQDLSEGGGLLGVAMTDLATGEYGFVMKCGVYNTCTVQDTCALDAALVADADGGFRAAVGGDVLWQAGVCLEVVASAATAVSVYINGI